MTDISCDSSARQKIHMKHQAFFSSKDKSEKKSVLLASVRVIFFSNVLQSILCITSVNPELQIRGGIEDNSKIIFLISPLKTYVVTPH